LGGVVTKCAVVLVLLVSIAGIVYIANHAGAKVFIKDLKKNNYYGGSDEHRGREEWDGRGGRGGGTATTTTTT